jgi:5'-3' exonuclease
MLIVDVSNVIYAGYYAMRNKLTFKGIEMSDFDKLVTKALYGFFMTFFYRFDANPLAAYTFLCFDPQGRGTSWRADVLPQYKAKRREYKNEAEKYEKETTAAAVHEACRILREDLGPYMPWFTVYGSRYEADDLIAGIVAAYPETGSEIVSSDKDLFQLIGNYPVTIYASPKSLLITPNNWNDAVAVKARSKGQTVIYSPRPENYLAFRVFSGDASDNIPGVPKFGEVTAAKVFSLPPIFNDMPLLTALHRTPMSVLKKAKITTVNATSKVLKSPETKQIVDRNWSLMSLHDSVDRLNADGGVGQFVSSSVEDWFKVGRQVFWDFLQQRRFKSLESKVNQLDDMAERKRSYARNRANSPS